VRKKRDSVVLLSFCAAAGAAVAGLPQKAANLYFHRSVIQTERQRPAALIPKSQVAARAQNCAL
jgi:hypothetical protein